jgi:hypothetical protein
MCRTQGFAAWSCVALLLSATIVDGGDALRMEVSPAVSRAPAVLTVRVNVEPSNENRSLQIVVESPTFHRSREIELDGMDSTPLQVLEYRNLPAGVYQVTSVLMGSDGPRAKVLRLAKVESPAAAD